MTSDATEVGVGSPRHGAKAEAPGVPRGYKRTEVGVIPADWSPVSVADVARVKGGKRLPAGFTLADDPTPYPYVRVSDMYPGGVDVSAIKYVPEAAFPAIRNYRIYADEIFISVAGTLGIVGIVPKEISGANLTENADRLTDLRCERDYLKYWLMSRPIQDAIESIRTVGAQPKLALGRIARFEIALPPRCEQRAIAEALSDVDGLLGALEALIAKKRAIKQAAMQQLLTGKTRLPGFSGEWETKRLGELGRFRGGTGFPTAAQGVTSGDYPFFKVSDMNNDGNETFMQVANNYVSEQVRKALGATAFPANSIVFAKVGAAVFLERKKVLSKPSCLDNNMAAFVLDHGAADYRFIHLVFLNTTLGDLVSTTALPSLSNSILSSIECRLPPTEEQSAIATVLSDMDAEIAALEARRDKIRAIKQGMMQQLLTGRVRLVKPEAAA